MMRAQQYHRANRELVEAFVLGYKKSRKFDAFMDTADVPEAHKTLEARATSGSTVLTI